MVNSNHTHTPRGIKGVYYMIFNFLKSVPSISTKELESILSSKIQLIDVRSPAEYQQGHLPFSKNIPLNRVQSFKPKHSNQPIYVMCQSGVRSKSASRILQKKGYEVKSVRGGMSQWSGSIKGGNK